MIERLENRLVLTGPYSNYDLTQQHQDQLLEGLSGLSGFGSQLSDSGDYARPFSAIRNRDGSPVSLGRLGPIGDTLAQDIENPIRDFFSNASNLPVSTDRLVFSLGDQPHSIAFDGGLEDGVLDQLVFDIHIRREYLHPIFSYAFVNEPDAIPLKVSLELELQLTTVVDVQFTFGLILDSSLNAAQAFFVRDLSINVGFDVENVLGPYQIEIGILRVSTPTIAFNSTLEVHTTLIGSGDRDQLFLEDFNTTEVLSIVDSRYTSDSLDVTYNMDVSLGQWRIEGPQFVRAIGSFFGFDPAITFSPNLSEAFLFGRISTDEIVSGMDQFQAWLSSLANASVFDIDIPFTSSASIGSVYDPGEGLNSYVASLRGADGLASFDSAQDFPYTGNGIDYDPVTNRLSYVVARNLSSQRTSSRATRIDSDSLLGLSSDVRAEIEGDGSLSYLLSFDLSQETAPIDDRMLLSNMKLTTTIEPTASGLSRQAAFGGLGLSFGDAVLSGAHTIETWIGDANSAATALSLSELYYRLNAPETLLQRSQRMTGSTQLRVTGLSVIDSLFSLAVGAELIATASDLATGTIEFATPSATELLSYTNVTFDYLTRNLSDAILGTESWDEVADGALSTIGQNIENFGAIRQQKIVDAIDDAKEQFASASNAGRLIVQDLPRFARNLTVATTSGFLSFSSTLTSNVGNGILNWLVDANVSETVPVEVGIGFESLFDYTSSPSVDDTDDFAGRRSMVL